ncbi:hypothetical protein D6856_14670 [Butyrivibrio sp. XB500-5]|uniref:Pycsar system effector family protein n=1 Tax=Butyrivibrio sp. XB500-5 TaxID=2364880 RepID=UPI000EAA0E38|nr:Pycsar system effector family protein [Butyrivibrio sp. XB500-5]RKM56737.1 hypothetical protein D6856_14670 [Butyrivibrio sp. XB500-5]
MGKRVDRIKLSEKNLDRVIGFINNCDTKASIVLALIGILLTMISTVLPVTIVEIRNSDDFDMNVEYILLVVLTIISIVSLIVSIILLINVLCGRVKVIGESKIYFGDISSYDESDYVDLIRQLKKTDYEMDLLRQVKINSDICKKKFDRFNISLVFLLIGLLSFGIAIMLIVICL